MGRLQDTENYKYVILLAHFQGGTIKKVIIVTRGNDRMTK